MEDLFLLLNSLKMNADIVSIGDELLIGQVINTNSSWIARQLNLIGIKVKKMITIGDIKQEIILTLKESSQNSNIIFITGGLGPTSDDITKPALCEYFNTSMRFDDEVFSIVDQFVSKRGGFMNDLNREQAMVPVSARIIKNKIGTAPGLLFEKDSVIYISMPGVPFEMEAMMNESILPLIKEQFHLPIIFHKTILTTGIPESKLAITIEKWENQLPEDIKLAYLPSPGMVRLRLSGYGNETLINSISKEVDKLKLILRDAIYGFDSDTMESVVGGLLKSRNKTLATAESCTGGNVARLITSVSGSSEYFKGSIVAYSNDIKTNHLKVPIDLINSKGSVSKEVVELMAKNIVDIFNCDYSIAISGIAGPTGGTKKKPVGLVWIAVASKEKKIVSEKFLFGDSRDRNITRASAAALNLLRIYIQKPKEDN
jgi:nicotinamide-nucleotide amidase